MEAIHRSLYYHKIGDRIRNGSCWPKNWYKWNVFHIVITSESTHYSFFFNRNRLHHNSSFSWIKYFSLSTTKLEEKKRPIFNEYMLKSAFLNRTTYLKFACFAMKCWHLATYQEGKLNKHILWRETSIW